MPRDRHRQGQGPGQGRGCQGKTITIGTTQEIENLATAANIVRQAAEQIGLRVQIRSVSGANFINFFTDPKARVGIDAFPTVNYPDYGDPAGLYNTFVIPGGTQNYDKYSNPQITKLLDDRPLDGQPRPPRQSRRQGRRRDRPAAAVDRHGGSRQPADHQPPAHRAPTSFDYMGGPWANLMGGR